MTLPPATRSIRRSTIRPTSSPRKGLNNRASDIGNLLDSIGNGVQVLQAANTGITSLQGLVSSAQSIANQVLQTPVGYSTKSNITSAALHGATANDLLGSVSVATNASAAAATALTTITSTDSTAATAGTVTAGTFSAIDVSGYRFGGHRFHPHGHGRPFGGHFRYLGPHLHGQRSGS